MPEWDQTIWRYLDFVKLFSMVSDRALYFCRLDKLGDKYEGAKGLLRNQTAYDDHYRRFFKEAVRTAPGVKDVPDVVMDQQAERLLKDIRSIGETARQQVFVNCWYESNHESQAMWQLYGQIGRSIAICSTPKDILDSLKSNDRLRIGRIKYVDFRNTFADVNDAIWKKHISFSHEREVRILFQEPRSTAESGKKLPCDLVKLIKHIVLAPHCEPWFEGLVRALLQKFDLDLFVMRSQLEDEPFY